MYMCVHVSVGDHGSQKWVPDPMEIELQVEYLDWVQVTELSTLLFTHDPCLQPCFLILLNPNNPTAPPHI